METHVVSEPFTEFAFTHHVNQILIDYFMEQLSESPDAVIMYAFRVQLSRLCWDFSTTIRNARTSMSIPR